MRVRIAILATVMLVGLRGVAADLEFAVVGDTRPRFESESFKPFESLIVKINAAKPALVVNLGDLIYGYGPRSKEKQWDKYQAVIRTIQPPYYQVPGNHDTHSKAARRVYGRRFGKFYQSFDYGDCHFVLLDNGERQRWGYMGPAQLNWLKEDLAQTHARAVFVFMHFPVWEPERITPEYYRFWVETLHPLFVQSRVRAVFAGHYHTYGPTREFDGIRYFITGGGGAELRPDYKKSGGEYHFMKVRLSEDHLDVRVVTERGELTDPEADIMGGLQFAARNVSRIGINPKEQDLSGGVTFNVSVENPYSEYMTGEAAWLMDASAFQVEPSRVSIQIPSGGTHAYTFTLKALQKTSTLPSLPQLEFNVLSGGHRHRFRREVRFVQAIRTSYATTGPVLDGKLSDWEGTSALKLAEGTAVEAELRSCYDAQTLYLAFRVPTVDTEEAKELGFSDSFQIGIARLVSPTEFGSDLLRLGFNTGTSEPIDRTPGHKPGTVVPGVRSVSRFLNGHTNYEIAIPLRLLNRLRPGPDKRLMLDLSFLVPGTGAEAEEPLDPKPNTFSYRVRYGSDSLVPIYFIELNLQSQR